MDSEESLQDSFWTEYKARFGKPQLPMGDLGRKSITVCLESDGAVERFDIEGTGYIPVGSGIPRVETILSALDKYNITGAIETQRW